MCPTLKDICSPKQSLYYGTHKWLKGHSGPRNPKDVFDSRSPGESRLSLTSSALTVQFLSQRLKCHSSAPVHIPKNAASDLAVRWHAQLHLWRNCFRARIIPGVSCAIPRVSIWSLQGYSKLIILHVTESWLKEQCRLFGKNEGCTFQSI